MCSIPRVSKVLVACVMHVELCPTLQLMAATIELYKTVDVLNLHANQQAKTCGEAKKVVSTRIADRHCIILFGLCILGRLERLKGSF